MAVIYRAHGGQEYAAMITDVRSARDVDVTTFPPGGGSFHLTRIPFVKFRLDSDAESICYPAKPDEDKPA